jgi:hypothetical protein
MLLLAVLSISLVIHAENRKFYFDYILNEVECNDNPTSGNFENQLVSGLNVSHYSDSLLDIVFEFEATHINFNLTNKAKKTMKINWDDMTLYIGGASHQVFHSGVVMKDRCDHKQPTSVMKGMPMSDFIIPCDMVEYSTYLERFVYSFLLFEERYDNSIVKLLFPVEIDNQKYEYVFTYTAKYNKKKVKINFVGGGMIEFVEVK